MILSYCVYIRVYLCLSDRRVSVFEALSSLCSLYLLRSNLIAPVTRQNSCARQSTNTQTDYYLLHAKSMHTLIRAFIFVIFALPLTSSLEAKISPWTHLFPPLSFQKHRPLLSKNLKWKYFSLLGREGECPVLKENAVSGYFQGNGWCW